MITHEDKYPPKNSQNDQVIPPSTAKSKAKNKHGKEGVHSSPESTLERFFSYPLRDFLQDHYTGLFITDEHNILLWMNDVIMEHPSVGDEVGLTLGKPVINILRYFEQFVAHPALLADTIHELLEKKKPYIDYAFLLKDGRNMSLDYYPVYHDGKYGGAIWRLVNKTPKKADDADARTMPSDNSFSEKLDKFHIASCELNMKGGIIACSPFLSKLTGYREKELLRTNFIDLCRSGQHIIKGLKTHRTGGLSKSFAPFELELILRDGSTKWMQCRTFSKFDSAKNLTGYTLLLNEISEQKDIQKDLEHAKNVAEAALRTQQQFLANMSHDIRTPLNAIIGMVFLLQDTPLDEEQLEYIKVLKNSSNILLGMLNGVLDFAKIESGKQEVHQREIDLPRLVQSLVDAISYKIINKPVKVTCHIDKKITHILLGDDILLNQILMNLLGNAEKFTAKGEISVQAKLVKEFNTTAWVEFKVIDTGIGISKGRQNEIFQDFIQADENIGVTYGGSGLGLFICKKLVEVLGGQISLESTPGKGTAFTFSIPFTMTNQLLKTGKVSTTHHYSFEGQDIRLLVVEDNPMNLQYLSSLLQKYKIDFDIATTGKQALEKANEHYYNLILMDMQLPVMSGMEVAVQIREKENPNAATPIVMVSAAAFQSTVDKAKESGVNELLPKPYTPNQLLDVLLKYLAEDEEDSSSDIKLPTDDPNRFKFDERLDTDYLQKLYSGNCEYAISLFEVFLSCMEKDWEEIQEAITKKDWTTLKNLVHKVKPNFSMVGLTGITRAMEEVYKNLKENKRTKALTLLSGVQEEMQQMMPLVKSELSRMEEFAGHGIT